jgi:hypothetical protein
MSDQRHKRQLPIRRALIAGAAVGLVGIIGTSISLGYSFFEILVVSLGVVIILSAIGGVTYWVNTRRRRYEVQ